MRKTKIIKQLLKEVDFWKYNCNTLRAENELLQFMVSEGKFPVQFYSTGIEESFQEVNKNGVTIRKEKYNVRFIDSYGDIKTTTVGFFHEPILKIVKNNVEECIFTATEDKRKATWFKLCKTKKLVVEIPKPYDYSNNNNNNKLNCNS